MSRLFRQLTAAVALLVVPAIASAQTGTTVSGRVTSEAGAPIAFANVVLEGMGMGAQTRDDGNYSILVPSARVRGQQATITARAIGYRASSASITLSSGNVTQNFSLGANPLRLGEVVVTGAGTTNTTEKLGTAISSVRSEEILKSNEINAVTALAAKAPGVVVTSSSGEPGSSTFIQIRGAKSIQGTSQPMFVVDGIPVDNTTEVTTAMTAGTVTPNRMADLNPADIESVEILKGAAAAAIYGARAGAGVVLITTKRGRSGETRYSFRSSISQDEVNTDYPLQTRFGQGSEGVTQPCPGLNCGLTGASFGPELPVGTKIYDHFGEMFTTGHLWDNSVSVSGGGERTTFYLSGGFADHQGTIIGPNSTYRRTTLLLKGTHDLSDKLRVGGNFNYVDVRGSFIQTGSNTSGLLLGALRTPPEFNNANYIDSTTGLHRSYRFPNPGANSGALSRRYDNPFFIVNEMKNTSDVGRMFGSFNADFTPLTWLNVKYTLGADYSSDARLEGLPPTSSNVDPSGALDRGNYTNYQIDHNLLATASKDFSQNLSTSLTLGQNLNSRKYQRIQLQGRGFISPDIFTLPNTISTNLQSFDRETLVHLESYFAEGKVDLWNQLFLTGGVRNDASSTFGQSVRRNWFPKGSVAWAFSEALGMSNGSGLFSYGKLRAAYGETGREPFAYQTITGFTTAALGDGWGPITNPTQAGNGGSYPAAARGQDKLKPERNAELEYGLDLAFFDSKVDLGFTYYDAKSRDVIIQLPLAPSTGFTSQVQNAAEIENKGIEVALNVRPITTNNFAWSVGAQWSRNRNLVTDLRGADNFGLDSFYGSAKAGHPFGVFLDYDFGRCRYSEGDANVIDGFDVNAFCRSVDAPDGAMYINEEGFPIFDPLQRVVGDPNPDWTGNFSTSVTLFKKLQISALVDIRRGGTVWNGTKGALFNFGAHRDTEIRGQTRVFGRDFMPGVVTGPGAGKDALIADSTWFTNLGSGFVGPSIQFNEDGSFTKLREISVAYTLDGPWVRNSLGFSSLDLRLSGRNLGLWTDYTGIDPESNLSGAGAARGNDYFNNPQTRSVVFSVSLNR